MMLNIFIVALGGALGAVARYQLNLYIVAASRFELPVATLVVNVLGSFFFGLMFYLIAEKSLLNEYWRLLCLVGFAGAFTTFSTFSYELLMLMQKGELMSALLLALANVILSLLAIFLAYSGARQLLA